MNENNKGYSDYGRIDLTKENIEPVEGSSEFYSSGVESERIDLTREDIEPIKSNSGGEFYSEELPFQAERIDLTKEDIPPVINNNVQVKQEEIEIKDYDSEKGISQVYIPEVPENKLFQKIMKIVLIILGVLLVIGIGFYIYSNQPKQLFLTSINKMYSNLTDNYYKVADLASDKEGVVSNSVHTNFSLKTTSQEYVESVDIINNMGLMFEGQNDYESKVSAYNLTLKSGETDTLNANFYGAKNEMYVELKNIFSKYIKIDLDENMYNTLYDGTNIKNMKECLSNIKNLYLSELRNDDFSKTKEEIIINGTTFKTKKVVLKLAEARINEINNNVIDSILADSKLIKKFSQVASINEGELKKILRDLKNSVSNVSLEIDVYMYEKNPIKTHLKINDANENYEFVINDVNNYFDLTYKENNYIILSVITEDQTTIINYGDMLTSITKEDDFYSFVINSNYEKTEGTIKSSKKEISNKETVNTLVMSIKLDAVSTLTIEIKITQKKIDKIILPDTTNSVNINELTEGDYNLIKENFLNNKVIQTIFGDLIVSNE